MRKFTMNVSPKEEEKIGLLCTAFGCSWVAMLRRAIDLLLVYVQAAENKQKLCVVDEDGKVVERVCIL